MDLFHLKKSVGCEFIAEVSHLIAGYSEDRATVFFKVQETTEKMV